MSKRRGSEAKRVGEHHDGSFGVYMAHKIQKLRSQNVSLVSSAGVSSPLSAAHTSAHSSTPQHEQQSSLSEGSPSSNAIFQGVHIYVDGYTIPSKEELRHLLLLHGGGFEHYETSRVTHIIATHLPASKVLRLKCVSLLRVNDSVFIRQQQCSNARTAAVLGACWRQQEDAQADACGASRLDRPEH